VGFGETNGAGLAVEGPAIAGRLGALLAVGVERIGGALDVEPFGGQLGGVDIERRGAARGTEGPAPARRLAFLAVQLVAVGVDVAGLGAQLVAVGLEGRLDAVDIEGQDIEPIGTEGPAPARLPRGALHRRPARRGGHRGHRGRHARRTARRGRARIRAVGFGETNGAGLAVEGHALRRLAYLAVLFIGAGLAVEGQGIAGRLGALLAVDIERIGGALDVEPFGGQLGGVGLERRGAARGIEGPALARRALLAAPAGSARWTSRARASKGRSADRREARRALRLLAGSPSSPSGSARWGSRALRRSRSRASRA
jgi:hypothetical protein